MLGLTQPAHPARGSLNQDIQLGKFTRPPFTSVPQAHKVALVLQAIFAAHSPRIRAIPHPARPPPGPWPSQPTPAGAAEPQEALVKAGKATGSWLLPLGSFAPAVYAAAGQRVQLTIAAGGERVAWVLLAYAIGVLMGGRG